MLIFWIWTFDDILNIDEDEHAFGVLAEHDMMHELNAHHSPVAGTLNDINKILSHKSLIPMTRKTLIRLIMHVYGSAYDLKDHYHLATFWFVLIDLLLIKIKITNEREDLNRRGFVYESFYGMVNGEIPLANSDLQRQLRNMLDDFKTFNKSTECMDEVEQTKVDELESKFAEVF